MTDVKFKGTESFKRFDTDFMRVKCSEWLSVCFEQLKQGISSALKYASNLKSLVLIRDAVVQFESTLVDESTTSASASPLAQSPSISGTTVSWSHICLTLFGKSVELWSELVVPFYYAQAKQIIDNSFQLTLDNMVRNLNDTLRNKTFETSAGDHKCVQNIQKILICIPYSFVNVLNRLKIVARSRHQLVHVVDGSLELDVRRMVEYLIERCRNRRCRCRHRNCIISVTCQRVEQERLEWPAIQKRCQALRDHAGNCQVVQVARRRPQPSSQRHRVQLESVFVATTVGLGCGLVVVSVARVNARALSLGEQRCLAGQAQGPVPDAARRGPQKFQRVLANKPRLIQPEPERQSALASRQAQGRLA